MRVLLLSFFIFLGWSALADIQFRQFVWKADSSVEVHYSNGRSSTVAHGPVLREGETVDAATSPVAVTVVAFSNPFVAVTFVEEGREEGAVVVLERQNGNYLPITGMIRGRSGTLVSDLKGIVEGLHKTNRWDHSLALRALAGHFAANPKHTLQGFYDEVELGKIGRVAKPAPKGSPPPYRPSSGKTRQVKPKSNAVTRQPATTSSQPSRPPRPTPAFRLAPSRARAPGQPAAKPVQKPPPKTQPQKKPLAKPDSKKAGSHAQFDF